MRYALALFMVLVWSPFQVLAKDSAATTSTKSVEVDGVKLAYREVGSGEPIVLFNRLRGTLDTWDPAFVDALAEGYRVIMVDYSGVGYSEGKLTPDMVVIADTMAAFAKAIDLETFDLVGWSWGGALAQVFLIKHPAMVKRAVLIGTNPPGENEHPMRKDWFERAIKPVNDLNDEEILFFEPAYKESMAAAAASHERIYARQGVTDHIPSTMDAFNVFFAAAQKYHEDKEGIRQALMTSDVPMLIFCGDNDPGTPADNWFPLIRTIPRGQLLIMPRAGHGPQHQFPQLSADYIHVFLKGAL